MKKNIFFRLIIKSIICIIIFFVAMILIKKNSKYKNIIYDTLFDNNISFVFINSFYKKYLGDVLPFDNIIVDETVEVFNENLNYSEINHFKDGFKLTVNNNYLVPFIESGIIVYIGEKDNYGNTVIVQQNNGIDVWYGNVDSSNIELYDYINKGSLLGIANSNYFYLVFQKDGEFLDYKEYI